MDKAEELQAKFNALCDEQERLYKPEFEAIFDALYSIDEGQKEIYKTNGWCMNVTLPDAPDTDKIKQAIKKAGFTDEVLNRDFTRYAQIVIDGKKIMQEQASTKVSNVIAQKEMAVNTDEWQFVPMSIIAPESIMKGVINPILKADAMAGKGFFANITKISKEYEELDDFLGVEAYNCNHSFTNWLDILKQYNVAGKQGAFFDKTFTYYLFQLISICSTIIKDNTDRPNKVKNSLNDIITIFDEIPIWGLFIQMLMLQGLCTMLESIDINEGESGFDETHSLYNWLVDRLFEKEVQFCFVPYGDEDKQILKPLCNYLYSTDLGQMVQNTIFKNNEPQQANNGQTTCELDLPSELNTERARKYFAKAKEAQYIKVTDSGLQWVFGDGRGNKVTLGYFIQKVFCPNNTETIPETAINKLFGVTRIGSAITQITSAKKPQKWRTEIDKLFE